jgi:hypothetical protein
MAKAQRDKIEYDFEDLRRNTDPVNKAVLDQLGIDDEELSDDERHDDKKAKDDSEELDDKDDVDREDDELDEDGEYKPAKMTQKMRKRIMGIKRDANRAIEAAKAEAGETISKLEKRVQELERTGKTDEISNEFDGKIQDIESKIEQAMEAGDSKAVAKLTREMSELASDMRDRKRKLEAERDEPDDLDEDKRPKIIPRAAEWVKEQDWWDDEDLGHVRAYVRKADIALQKKGYRPTDDDFYEQLEAIVEKKYPGVVEHTMSGDYGLDDEDDDDDDLDDEDEFGDIPSKSRRAKSKRVRRRGPVSEGDRGGVSRAKKAIRNKKGKTLTRTRVANMRMFGMDPENPEHVEAYLDNNP